MNNLSFVGNNLCIDVADKNHTGRDCDRRQSTAEQSRVAWRWHWSFSVVSLGCPDQGSVEREGEGEAEREGKLNWSLSSWRIKPHNFSRSRPRRCGGHIHFALLHYSLGDYDPHQMHSCMPLHCTAPELPLSGRKRRNVPT